MTITKHFVINKTTAQVLRWGCVEFASEDSFVSVAEEVIHESDILIGPKALNPDVAEGGVWYWNATAKGFQQTPPE